MTLIEIISKNIKKHRNVKNMSIRELSIDSGVSLSLVSWLDHGKRNNVSLHTLEKLASSLSVKVIDLLQDQ